MGCLKLTYDPDESLLFISKGVENAKKSAQGFISTDPLKDKYIQLSPYQYAGNDPIGDIDVDGLEGTKTPVLPIAPSDATNIDPIRDRRLLIQQDVQQRQEKQASLQQLLSGNGPDPRNNPNATFIGADNRSDFQKKESQKQLRRIEAQQNFQKLKDDISATSPFVGGGGDFGFGFAATTAEGLKQAPFIIAPELLSARASSFLGQAGKIGRAIEGSKAFKTVQPFTSAFIFDASTAGVAQSINRFAETGEISFKPGEIDLANAFIKGIFSTAFGKQFGKDNPLASVLLEEGLKTVFDASLDQGIRRKKLDQSNEILAEFGLRLAFKAIPGKNKDSFGNTISKPGKEFVIETIKKESRGNLIDIFAPKRNQE